MKKTTCFFLLFIFLFSCINNNNNISSMNGRITEEDKIYNSILDTNIYYENTVKVFKDFTSEWVRDSLGLTGFRRSAYIWDSNICSYRFNGMDLRGIPIEIILKIFGKPYEQGIENESNSLTISYYLGCYKIYDVCALEFYFNKENKLEEIIEVKDYGK